MTNRKQGLLIVYGVALLLVTLVGYDPQQDWQPYITVWA